MTRLEKEGRERKREREGGGGGVGGRGFEPATVPTPRKRSADRAERSPRRAPVAREELGTRDRTPLGATRRRPSARRRAATKVISSQNIRTRATRLLRPTSPTSSTSPRRFPAGAAFEGFPVVVVAELVSASEHAAESSGDASRAHGAERVALIAGRSRVLGRLSKFQARRTTLPERRVSSADGRGRPRRRARAARVHPTATTSVAAAHADCARVLVGSETRGYRRV